MKFMDSLPPMTYPFVRAISVCIYEDEEGERSIANELITNGHYISFNNN